MLRCLFILSGYHLESHAYVTSPGHTHPFKIDVWCIWVQLRKLINQESKHVLELKHLTSEKASLEIH